MSISVINFFQFTYLDPLSSSHIAELLTWSVTHIFLAFWRRCSKTISYKSSFFYRCQFLIFSMLKFFFHYSQCRYRNPWTQNNETPIILNTKTVTKVFSKGRHQIISMTLKALKKATIYKKFVVKSSLPVNPKHSFKCVQAKLDVHSILYKLGKLLLHPCTWVF